MKYKTYLYEPITGRDEKKFVNDCLDSNWISSKGKYIEKFEKKFSNFIKIKYSITVSNGTAAAIVNPTTKISKVLVLADIAWKPNDNEMENTSFNDYDWDKWKKSNY